MAEVIKMPGTVRSVNGIKPDANANVELEVKPLFLIKQFSYAITYDDYPQWENGNMGKWKLRKTVAEWGLPENFPQNIRSLFLRIFISGVFSFLGAGNRKGADRLPLWDQGKEVHAFVNQYNGSFDQSFTYQSIWV